MLMNMPRTIKTVKRVLLHVCLILVASFGVFPFIWTTGSSFKTLDEFYELRPSILPRNPTVMNYVYVFRGIGEGGQKSGAAYMMILYRNSIYTTVVSTLLTVLISSLAGYAFARLRFKGRDAIFYFFIVLMFLPAGGTLMALYALLRTLKLIDKLWGLILVYTGGGGTALFLMRQIFLNIPSEIEDAAKVDGANSARIAFQIMFPLATSGMVLVGIMQFMRAWSEFILPQTFIRTSEKMTLPIGMWRVANNLAQARTLPSPGVTYTVMLLIVVPAVLVFVVMQKWFIRGAVEGLKL
jgi:multiple sugar transport system permease protein